MSYSGQLLPRLHALDEFEVSFESYCEDIAETNLYQAKVSQFRLRDAHNAWMEDIVRVDGREKKVDGLDHLKQCGHLAYWLRRMGPVYEFKDLIKSNNIQVDPMVRPAIDRFQAFLKRYGSEYIAFDFSYRTIWFYEKNRTDGKRKQNPPELTHNYTADVCHMMKFKHVSPHSMFLIYKSLILGAT